MIQLIRDFVMISPDPTMKISQGGIIIPDTAQRRAKTGTVVAKAPGADAAFETDQKVMFDVQSGIDIQYDGQPYKVVRAPHVWAIIDAQPE